MLLESFETDGANVSAAAKLLTIVVALYKRGKKACKVHEMQCNPFVQMCSLLKSVPVTAAAASLSSVA